MSPYALRDIEGNVLTSGNFYWSDIKRNITRFTGKYNKDNHALFESPDGSFIIDSNTARTTLHPIHNPQDYLEKKLKVEGWMKQELELKLEEDLEPEHLFMGPQQDHGLFEKHPWKRDGGYIHPDKRYLDSAIQGPPRIPGQKDINSAIQGPPSPHR